MCVCTIPYSVWFLICCVLRSSTCQPPKIAKHGSHIKTFGIFLLEEFPGGRLDTVTGRISQALPGEIPVTATKDPLECVRKNNWCWKKNQLRKLRMSKELRNSMKLLFYWIVRCVPCIKRGVSYHPEWASPSTCILFFFARMYFFPNQHCWFLPMKSQRY